MARIVTGQKAVSGTAAQLTSSTTKVETLILKALPGNTGDVYFGASGVPRSDVWPR